MQWQASNTLAQQRVTQIRGDVKTKNVLFTSWSSQAVFWYGKDLTHANIYKW